jgi:hypothetical protein
MKPTNAAVKMTVRFHWGLIHSQEQAFRDWFTIWFSPTCRFLICLVNSRHTNTTTCMKKVAAPSMECWIEPVVMPVTGNSCQNLRCPIFPTAAASLAVTGFSLALANSGDGEPNWRIAVDPLWSSQCQLWMLRTQILRWNRTIICKHEV